MAVAVNGAGRHVLKAVPAFLLGTTFLLAACSGPAQVSRSAYQCSPQVLPPAGQLVTRNAPRGDLHLEEVAGCAYTGLRSAALASEQGAETPSVIAHGPDAGNSGDAPEPEEASDTGGNVPELLPDDSTPNDVSTPGTPPEGAEEAGNPPGGQDQIGDQNGGFEGNDEGAIEDEGNGGDQGDTQGNGGQGGNQGANGDGNGQNDGSGGPQGNNGLGNGDEGDCSGNGCNDSTNPGNGGGGSGGQGHGKK